MRVSQTVLPSIFHFVLHASQMCEKFTELHCNFAEGIIIFQDNLHLWQMCFSTFEVKHISLLCSYWHSAFRTASFSTYNGVLTGCLSNSQKSDGANLWLLGRELQHSELELRNSQRSVHTCVCPDVVMEEQYFGYFPFLDKLDKGKHPYFLVFQYNGQSSVLSS